MIASCPTVDVFLSVASSDVERIQRFIPLWGLRSLHVVKGSRTFVETLQLEGAVLPLVGRPDRFTVRVDEIAGQ